MRGTYFFIGPLLFLFQYCAQVQPPSGGPKDQKPPQVTKAVPPNGTVNFKGNGFLLHFDEYIRSARLQQEWVVSPPIDPAPKVTVEGKSLRVEWEGSLKADRTYSFRFGNGIQDITEGNSTENLVYAISTGPHLDSLHYEGRVVDARTMEGSEGVLTMLYRDRADSVPRTQKPYYFDRTDEKGHFDIPYLPDRNYKFFALKDGNRNQLFDLPDEAIAFLKDPVRPYQADSAGDVLIRLFQEAREDQFIDSRAVRPGFVRLILKRGSEEAGLQALGDSALPWGHIKVHRKGSDTLSYWFPDRSMPDSIDLALRVDGELLDTLMVRNGAELWGKDEALNLEKSFQDPLELNEAAAFQAQYPLQRLDTSSIVGVSDSDTVALEPEIGGKEQRKLILRNREAFLESGLKLTLHPGALLDTFGHRLQDTLDYSFEVRKKDHYGKLELSLKAKGKGEERVVLSLLDDQEEQVRRRVDSTGSILNFPFLHPGPYRLELIIDEIPNGRWDPGEYPDRQPEPVLFYPDTVKIRSNWEKRIEWKGIGE